MLSIVIPSYNRRDQLFKLLSDIYEQTTESFEVIVVDDSSTDDSVIAISSSYPRAKILVNDHNCGPAASRNRGVLAAGGDFILGLDSDVTIPDRRLFDKVLRTFNVETEVACLALKILEPDGTTDDAERWCHPFPLTESNKVSLTTYFSGTGYAVRRVPMIKAGLFPEIFYMHHEEVELSYRLLDQGDLILYCPDLSVQHHVVKSSTRSFVESYYHPRNQILLVLLSFPWMKAVVHLLPRTIYQLTLAIKNRTFRDYIGAVVNACENTHLLLSMRKPLNKKTFTIISRIQNKYNLPFRRTLKQSYLRESSES